MALSDSPDGGNLSWRVARHCDGGACVRVAPAGEMILLGDSKNPDGPILSYTRTEWEAFITGIKRGEFDNIH
jgi:predicted secreted Zn-dependent protease